MKPFHIHTPDSAPAPADTTLRGIEKMLGFVPNVFAVMAEAPVALRAFAELNTRFTETSLTPTEREIVELAASVGNACVYCVAGHTAFAKRQAVPDDVIDAVRAGVPIADPKLEALHGFVRAMVERRGKLMPVDLDRFFAAGYTPAHVHEVILGISVKAFSNMTGNLTGIPLDAAFAAYAWEPADASAPVSGDRQAA